MKFSFYKDRDKILKTYKQKRKYIRGAEHDGVDIDTEFRKDIHICADFPARVMKARNYLRPFLRKSKAEARNTYIRYDTLIIDNSAYTFDADYEDIVLVEK